jgi:hypothetical protein
MSLFLTMPESTPIAVNCFCSFRVQARIFGLRDVEDFAVCLVGFEVDADLMSVAEGLVTVSVDLGSTNEGLMEEDKDLLADEDGSV